jgi:hypothetical protein
MMRVCNLIFKIESTKQMPTQLFAHEAKRVFNGLFFDGLFE